MKAEDEIRERPLRRPFQIPGADDRSFPAAPLYIGPDDFIFITSAGSLAGATLALRGRMYRADGQLYYLDETITPSSNRTAATVTKQLGEGYLESLQVVDTSNTLRRGQCFVQVGLARGSIQTPVITTTLIQEYATKSFSPAWPGGRLIASTEGRGNLRGIVGTAPSAGAECSETVPTGARWIIHGVIINLVTAVAVANRQIELIFDNGTNNFDFVAPAVNQAASLNWTYAYGKARQFYTSVAANNIPMPLPTEVNLGSAFRMRTGTFGLQAADQYASPVYEVEEWIEL